MPGGKQVDGTGRLAARQHLASHPTLVAPVAPQVELAAGQDQRGGPPRPLHSIALALALALDPDQRAGAQRCKPVLRVWRQVGQQLAQFVQRLGRPAQQGLGVEQHGVDPQTAVASTFEMGDQRGGEQYGRRCLGAEVGQEGRESAVQAPDPALLGPVLEPLQQPIAVTTRPAQAWRAHASQRPVPPSIASRAPSKAGDGSTR